MTCLSRQGTSSFSFTDKNLLAGSKDAFNFGWKCGWVCLRTFFGELYFFAQFVIKEPPFHRWNLLNCKAKLLLDYIFNCSLKFTCNNKKKQKKTLRLRKGLNSMVFNITLFLSLVKHSLKLNHNLIKVKKKIILVGAPLPSRIGFYW